MCFIAPAFSGILAKERAYVTSDGFHPTAESIVLRCLIGVVGKNLRAEVSRPDLVMTFCDVSGTSGPPLPVARRRILYFKVVWDLSDMKNVFVTVLIAKDCWVRLR